MLPLPLGLFAQYARDTEERINELEVLVLSLVRACGECGVLDGDSLSEARKVVLGSRRKHTANTALEQLLAHLSKEVVDDISTSHSDQQRQEQQQEQSAEETQSPADTLPSPTIVALSPLLDTLPQQVLFPHSGSFAGDDSTTSVPVRETSQSVSDTPPSSLSLPAPPADTRVKSASVSTGGTVGRSPRGHKRTQSKSRFGKRAGSTVMQDIDEEEAGTGSSVFNRIRKAVSKNKYRFQEDGYDLDLTYIYDQVLAMGFPSESIEGLYRNNMKDVQRFFRSRHADHYKVYNLCSERSYPAERFDGPVERWPFDDHNPCPFKMLPMICGDLQRWTDDPKNVAAIHCKAGKGRTGLIITCFLMHQNICSTTPEALLYYGEKRTSDGHGVTIPSQRRYVSYYESLLKADDDRYAVFSDIGTSPEEVMNEPNEENDEEDDISMSEDSQTEAESDQENQQREKSTSEKRQQESRIRLRLRHCFESTSNMVVFLKEVHFLHTRIHLANFSFKIRGHAWDTIKFSSKHQAQSMEETDFEGSLIFLCGEHIPLRLGADIRVDGCRKTLKGKESVMHMWVNTAFVGEDGVVLLEKHEIDKAHKDTSHKAFPADMHVKLVFSPPQVQ